ncbi:hypothetical protein J6590_084683 [Homalodisca vitripennis]|nr:hypothetical protein J6590_084683 [Homalodisca vitripennis]
MHVPSSSTSSILELRRQFKSRRRQTKGRQFHLLSLWQPFEFVFMVPISLLQDYLHTF